MRVISLRRTPDRLAKFRATNPHVSAEVLDAVDGKVLDRAALERAGIIGPGLIHSDGALGCLFSHMAFWDEVIDRDRPMTVFEDDAIIHRKFPEISRYVIDSLTDGWHICQWGFNFNAALVFAMIPGVVSCFAQHNLEEFHANITDYQDSRIDRPLPVKLYRSWGTCGYALSPLGAKFLRAREMVTRDCALEFPDMKITVRNIGVDVILNAFYPTIHAFVCLPPLVVTAGDDTTIEAPDFD